TYQRAKRKRDIHTQLSEVPGLGPKRTKQLLSHFGSVKRLRAAGAEEIATIPGFSETLARAISEHLADVHNPAESGILNAANNTPGAEEK
ncbi:MAG: helix-hairpin-helix domain-containing protein, partial [Microbacteriaceae bacterium]